MSPKIAVNTYRYDESREGLLMGDEDGLPGGFALGEGVRV